jgi:hypothetical protein
LRSIEILIEEFKSGINGEGQDVSNGLFTVSDVESLGIESCPMASRTRTIDTWRKEKFDADKALTRTGLAATLGYVERNARASRRASVSAGCKPADGSSRT